MYKMDSPIDFLVDYTVEDVPNVMEVRTEILEPTQSSAYRHTFRIDQSGFLDENTMSGTAVQSGVGGGQQYNWTATRVP